MKNTVKEAHFYIKQTVHYIALVQHNANQAQMMAKKTQSLVLLLMEVNLPQNQTINKQHLLKNKIKSVVNWFKEKSNQVRNKIVQGASNIKNRLLGVNNRQQTPLMLSNKIATKADIKKQINIKTPPTKAKMTHTQALNNGVCMYCLSPLK